PCGSRRRFSRARASWRLDRWRPANPAARAVPPRSGPTSRRPTSRTSTLKISGNSLRSTALLLLCLAGALRAQQVVITGRVLYGPAGRPVARTWVVLHQVSMGGGGQAIDSIRSDARGAYALA